MEDLYSVDRLAERDELHEMVRRARQEALAPSESRFQRATREALRNVTHADLIDELIDCEDAFAVAIEKNDAALLGRIVLAVRNGYAERLANRELGMPYSLPMADEVAAKVLAS